MRKIILSSIILLLIFGCGIKKINKKNRAIDLVVIKELYDLPSDSLESPMYTFRFFLKNSSAEALKISPVYLNTINHQCKSLYSSAINFNDNIESLDELKNKFISAPFFVVENQSEQFKYFFNFRNFKKPIVTKLFEERVTNLDPNRNYGFDKCTPLISFKKKKWIPIMAYDEREIGLENIYQYDLKINLSDKKIRLHYVSENLILSSNWIKIDETSDRIKKLFNY